MDKSMGWDEDPASWATALSIVGLQLILVSWFRARVVVVNTDLGPCQSPPKAFGDHLADGFLLLVAGD
jgi:hypothetical protein